MALSVASAEKSLQNTWRIWKAGIKKAEIHINSLGGSIVDGMTIYSAIKSCSIPVDTVCVGIAVSMAGVILQAGRSRKMVKWGQMMLHNPSGGDTKELDTLKQTLIKMLCPRTGISEQEMSDLMDETSWLDAEACLENKFIDEVADITTIANLPKITEKTSPQAAYKKLLEVVNSIELPQTPKGALNSDKQNLAQSPFRGLGQNKQPINTEHMKGLAALLELPENASEREFIKAVRALKNGAYSKDELDKLSEAIVCKEKELAELKEKYARMEEECKLSKLEAETLKHKNKEAETLALKAEADTIVNEAVKAGKIKAEAKNAWVDLYVADKERTRSLMQGLTAYRAAAKLNVENAGGSARPASIASAMAEKKREMDKRK
jgi:ATP-dependent protease ClpP protease subunit/regulator of replication initiation timing